MGVWYKGEGKNEEGFMPVLHKGDCEDVEGEWEFARTQRVTMERGNGSLGRGLERALPHKRRGCKGQWW